MFRLMPYWWRSRRRHHRPHCHHPKAAAPAVLLLYSIVINLKEKTMKVTLKWTTPALRADGTTALTLGEIAQTNVLRNGELLQSVNAVDSSLPLGNVFVDTTPLTGADTYVVETVTADGFTSGDSNAVTVTVASANPAAAITDLTADLSADDAA